MKNVYLLGFIATLILSVSSCQKCYKCHNVCKVCHEHHQLNTSDTTLTIVVSSNLLSEKYFVEYIDSLTSPSLGWVCHDTASTYNEKFCDSESKSAAELINKKEAGLVCNAE